MKLIDEILRAGETANESVLSRSGPQVFENLMIPAGSSGILSHNLGNQASSFWGDPVVQCPFETLEKPATRR
jgi:hypothetical protein